MISIRMCKVCREHKPKFELLRFVNIDNVATLDTKQKAQGRGIYFCKECLPLAIKRKQLKIDSE
ncbi:hypothetical protein FACS1894132_09930 [Clostridia bacterium]|nr:hypothetical protein FACS1894132_09930 [Clostridia bacterium]